ncbi:hypothetical protein EV697_10536 [Bisgaardia hudsonensis]|uniref:ATPases of ABC transporters with duplicated ATPase domains-containing protein n=1 Tax=Bisgaardia hudsonensis TaxID=109472 RepID=A0A4R2MTR1_9PAST|nr:hypothetical protein [Bisgaardia hudsonensis]QLB13594.1 hypothetical protein A6A11_08240 [Bisgaardia hudsonensis]TCP11924.1 hypothetical protein EV697_10536 [Bisgaardia hudsonensis]
MKKILIILTALFLFGCASQSKIIEVPQQLQYHNKQYKLSGQQDLGSIARYVFLSENDTLQNWQTEIEVLFDRNIQKLSLQERINLRKNIYQKTNVAYFELKEKNNTLFSSVIYKPSSQYNDWQINIAKGKNIPNCGFIQYQYSLKVARNKKIMNMKKSKIVSHIKKYILDKEIKYIDKKLWQWNCK